MILALVSLARKTFKAPHGREARYSLKSQLLRTQPPEPLDFRFLRYIRIRNSPRLSVSVLALALALAGLSEFRKPSRGAFGGADFPGAREAPPGNLTISGRLAQPSDGLAPGLSNREAPAEAGRTLRSEQNHPLLASRVAPPRKQAAAAATGRKEERSKEKRK